MFNYNISTATDVRTPLLGQFKSESKITQKSIFRITKEDLAMFFKRKNVKKPDNQGESRVALNILAECSYNYGLCRLLGTDKDTGIIGDTKDIKRRQKFFGAHAIAIPKNQTFEFFLSSQFEDSNTQFLIVTATIYLALSIFSPNPSIFIESLTIYGGCLFAALISAWCDYNKECQHLKLKDEINNQTVVVYRGSFGTCMRILIRDLVVGDVIDLQQGDRVPADCLLLEEMDMRVDQSLYNRDEKDIVKEQSVQNSPDSEEPDNHKDNPDPFLFSDSKVMKGQGKAVILGVGENTLLWRNRKPSSLVVQEQKTHIEETLEKMANQIQKYAVLVTILSVLTHLIFLVFSIICSGNRSLISNNTLLEIGKIAITAVVLLIVAIPEGLSLSISLAMALSISNLKNDEILIKNIQSVQTCAMLHDICVSKTGTLTKGKLAVAKYHMTDRDELIENDHVQEPDYFASKLDISQELKEVIVENIVYNTDVRIEICEAEHKFKPSGQPLEVGLIQFLFDNRENVNDMFINRNRSSPKIVQFPFDQFLKRKVVVRQVQGDETLCRVYVKGAPEFVLPLCDRTLDLNIQPKRLTTEDKERLLYADGAPNNIYQMAHEGLKVISYAFKELTMDELRCLNDKYNTDTDEFRQEIEENLIYVGTFGMNDPINEDIKEAIYLTKYGKGKGQEAEEASTDDAKNEVTIRILSGDHLETVRKVGIEAGVISEAEAYDEKKVMDAQNFRSIIGNQSNYNKVWNPQKNAYQIIFSDLSKLEEIKKRVRVIARATSEDKLLFVSIIQQKGGIIGMTGESISDAEALSQADVGFCMGTGCEVSKDLSDLVILDNKFVSIHRSVLWGRAIFDNCRKFLQFQLTINIVICFITILGGLTLGQPPLNVIQLLWTNLIMDVLGAIALCTEPYHLERKTQRISKKYRIMLPEVWRQILIHSVWQILVMVILMYFGQFMFFEKSFNLIYTPARDIATGEATDRLRLNTILFHTFILMNLFNQINCRVVDQNEINVFKTLFNNKIFWFVAAFEFGVQYGMMFLTKFTIGSGLLGAAELTTVQHIICVLLGMTSLMVNPLVKKIKLDHFQNVYESIDLEKDNKNEFINKLWVSLSVFKEAAVSKLHQGSDGEALEDLAEDQE